MPLGGYRVVQHVCLSQSPKYKTINLDPSFHVHLQLPLCMDLI